MRSGEYKAFLDRTHPIGLKDNQRFIIRYNNRKFYDYKSREYVTLADLLTFVRSGDEITIVRKSGGGDITAMTLVDALNAEYLSRGTLPPLSEIVDKIRSQP